VGKVRKIALQFSGFSPINFRPKWVQYLARLRVALQLLVDEGLQFHTPFVKHTRSRYRYSVVEAAAPVQFALQLPELIQALLESASLQKRPGNAGL
jgi:hypothetical protein